MSRIRGLNKADSERFINKRTNDFKTFPEKIYCARINYNNGKKNRRGLTLKKAAAKIGISFVQLRKLELGRIKKPNVIVVSMIENIYGFKRGELVDILINQQRGT